MVVSRAEAVRVKYRGQIQEILKKLAVLKLVHLGSSLGNWIVCAATHQSRDPKKSCPQITCVQCRDNSEVKMEDEERPNRASG